MHMFYSGRGDRILHEAGACTDEICEEIYIIQANVHHYLFLLLQFMFAGITVALMLPKIRYSTDRK